MTTPTPHPARSDPADAAHHVEDALDEALDETFPASDPLPINPGPTHKEGPDAGTPP
jgi:hypothetical protein